MIYLFVLSTVIQIKPSQKCSVCHDMSGGTANKKCDKGPNQTLPFSQGSQAKKVGNI